jgi:2-amino-4-hydroxy-6-hydroxymethyldihydropteridine diphosphokinase
LNREPVWAFVALGANLGDAQQTVQDAIKALGELPLTSLLTASRLYQTAPHQALGPDFVNAVAKLSTRLSAPDLMQYLGALEQKAGRTRPFLNAPRTLDLDLLFYGDAVVQSDRLTLPHPRWATRAFVLWPLKDVAPDKVTPAHLAAVSGQAIRGLP